MYAIVKTGGKQYKVAEGDVIEVEKLAGEPGDAVTLAAVLLVDGDDLVTDAAKLAGLKGSRPGASWSSIESGARVGDKAVARFRSGHPHPGAIHS